MTINTQNSSKLGFGLMRLPKKNDQFDLEQIKQMIDDYLAAGLNYFDTAYAYLGSEEIARKVLVERYPRQDYFLTTKLPIWEMKSADDADKFFAEQLERAGVDYFDNYMLHSITTEAHYAGYEKFSCFQWGIAKKAAGLIKHFGISFHGNPPLLEQILDEHPEIEFVQIQVNYLDWDSKVIYSGELYKLLRKRNMPIIIMEPVKGGLLANVSAEVNDLFNTVHPGKSAAAWALSYAASLDGVITVLSGMSNLEQMTDNLATFTNFQAFSETEYQTIEQVINLMRKNKLIDCTDCKYCLKSCPQNINIPQIFNIINSFRTTGYDRIIHLMYKDTIPQNNNASACIACAKCEQQCPQHLPISKLMAESAAILSKDLA